MHPVPRQPPRPDGCAVPGVPQGRQLAERAWSRVPRQRRGEGYALRVLSSRSRRTGLQHGQVARRKRRELRPQARGLGAQAEARRGRVPRLSRGEVRRSRPPRSSRSGRPARATPGSKPPAPAVTRTCTARRWGRTAPTVTTPASWTVTPGFNHDTTAYELTGKHDAVKCDKCHLDPRLSPRSDGKGHLVPVYKPVSFGTCADCHTDPHDGKLGPKCADCHSTAGFKVIDKNRFDHDRTKYPLTGKHVDRVVRRVPQGLLHAGPQDAGLRDLRQLSPGRPQRYRDPGRQAGRLCALPHGRGIHALDLHRRDSREDQVSRSRASTRASSARRATPRAPPRPRLRSSAARRW